MSELAFSVPFYLALLATSQQQQFEAFHGFMLITRSSAIAEGPRDAGVPVEIW